MGRCLGPNGTQIGFVAGNGDLINPILIGFHRFKHNGPAEVIDPFAWMHIGLPQILQQVFLLQIGMQMGGGKGKGHRPMLRSERHPNRLRGGKRGFDQPNLDRVPPV